LGVVTSGAWKFLILLSVELILTYASTNSPKLLCNLEVTLLVLINSLLCFLLIYTQDTAKWKHKTSVKILRNSLC